MKFFFQKMGVKWK